MKGWRLIAGASLAGASGAYVVGRALYDVARPTDGATIAASANRTAYVVLDMQSGFTRPEHNPAPGDIAARIERINALAVVAGRRGWPVFAARMSVTEPRLRFALRMVGAPQPEPDSPATALDDRLELPGAAIFDKQRGDAFSNPAFDIALRAQGVRRLLISGLDGIASVQRTARGALNRGYEVVLIEDTISTAHPKDWAEWQQKLRILGAKSMRMTDASPS